MAKRINPTFNTFQEKVITGKSLNDGLEQASIVKVIVGEWMKNLSDKDRTYYIELHDKASETERKNPTK